MDGQNQFNHNFNGMNGGQGSNNTDEENMRRANEYNEWLIGELHHGHNTPFQPSNGSGAQSDSNRAPVAPMLPPRGTRAPQAPMTAAPSPTSHYPPAAIAATAPTGYFDSPPTPEVAHLWAEHHWERAVMHGVLTASENIVVSEGEAWQAYQNLMQYPLPPTTQAPGAFDYSREWLDRQILDQWEHASAGGPPETQNQRWVNARQLVIEQEQLRENTRLMFREAILANGGQVPPSLFPFLPNSRQALDNLMQPAQPTTRPSNQTQCTLREFLIQVSWRYQGHFGIHWERIGLGTWMRFMPHGEEVRRWRALLMQFWRGNDEESMIEVLEYIANTASFQLELYGTLIDPVLGRYDTREAFVYVVGEILNRYGTNRRIHTLAMQVVTMIHNSVNASVPTLGRPVAPTLGAQLWAAFMSRPASPVAFLPRSRDDALSTLSSGLHGQNHSPAPVVPIAPMTRQDPAGSSRRGRGRPAGAKNKPNSAAGSDSTAGSHPITTSTPAAPMNQPSSSRIAPAMHSWQLANTVPSGRGLRQRRAQVSYTGPSTQFEDDDEGEDEDGPRGQCPECCGIMPNMHVPECSQYVDRCDECGHVLPNHRRDCSEVDHGRW